MYHHSEIDMLRLLLGPGHTNYIAVHPTDRIAYSHDVPASLLIKNLDSSSNSNLLFDLANLGWVSRKLARSEVTMAVCS
jgi:hypothetical protein